MSKRLILCCDGTWMDSYDGYHKPTLIPYQPNGTLQVPSNVTRISRALTRVGRDGKLQIIYYQSGVGTGFSRVDTIAGGLLGIGISENIRVAYSFITTNYVPGDEIVLIGFSRGAFTVRSVAGMINDIGLLTRKGMQAFYPIFKDCENFQNEKYRDIFPDLPFPNKPRGPKASHEYKKRLLEHRLTRVVDPNGDRIGVQAVAVWDTVGALGIPSIPFLAKLGLQSSTKELKFNDTNLTSIVKHAFQALALDEHRAPFSPAVWERTDPQKATVDLRQVWFPGAHSNIGGGYDDQGVANITLAWMMDQLASIGIAFQDDIIEQVYAETVNYYENPPKTPATSFSGFTRGRARQWAKTDIYELYKPVRPWGLGKIYDSYLSFWRIAGSKSRTPGLYTRADPATLTDIRTNIPLMHTNERVHSCVRIRLDLEGLDLDDKGVYKCDPLLANDYWRLRQIRLNPNIDPIPMSASWGDVPPTASPPDDRRWVWEYNGPEELAPDSRVMVEENLGPYERKLLQLKKAAPPRNPHQRRHRRSRRRESRYSSTFSPEEQIVNSSAAEKSDNSHQRRSSQQPPPPILPLQHQHQHHQEPPRRRRSERGSNSDFDDEKIGSYRRPESHYSGRPRSRRDEVPIVMSGGAGRGEPLDERAQQRRNYGNDGRRRQESLHSSDEESGFNARADRRRPVDEEKFREYGSGGR